MNPVLLQSFSDELQHIAKEAAFNELLLKLSSWYPSDPSAVANMGRSIRQLVAAPTKEALKSRGQSLVRGAATATLHGVEDVSHAFGKLPDEIRAGIMSHPLVTEHGMHPHAAFQLLHMSSGKSGLMDTARNLGILKTQVPSLASSAAQTAGTVAPRPRLAIAA